MRLRPQGCMLRSETSSRRRHSAQTCGPWCVSNPFCIMPHATCFQPQAWSSLPQAWSSLPLATCFRPQAWSLLHHASCHLLSASSVVFSATGVVLPASCHLLSATGVISSASCLMPPAFSSNVVLSATGMVNSPPSMQWASAVDTSPAALLFARPKISAACPVAVGAQVRREVQGRGAAW